MTPPTIAFHLCVTTRTKSYPSAASHQTVDPNRGLRFLLVVEPDAQEASANSHCLFKGKAIPGKFVHKSTIKIIHQQGLLDPLGQEPTLQNTDLGTGPSLKIATDTPMDRQLLTLPKTCKVTCIAASVYHEHQLKKLTRSHNHLNGFPFFGCFSIPFTFNTFKIRDLALALRVQRSTAVMLHLVKNHAKTISNNHIKCHFKFQSLIISSVTGKRRTFFLQTRIWVGFLARGLVCKRCWIRLAVNRILNFGFRV